MTTRKTPLAARIALALAVSPFLVATAFAAPAMGYARDTALEASVKAELDRTMSTEAKDVSVLAQRGVVTLTGWVEQPHNENRAREIASTVPGVRRAVSNLHLWSSTDE
jgi:osmotically-inducible protein OsmY